MSKEYDRLLAHAKPIDKEHPQVVAEQVEANRQKLRAERAEAERDAVLARLTAAEAERDELREVVAAWQQLAREAKRLAREGNG